MSATPLAVQSFYNQNKFSTPNFNFSTDPGKPQTSAPYLPAYLLGSVNNPSSPVYSRTLATGPYQNHSPSKMVSKSPPNHQSGFPYTSPVDRRQQRSTTSSQDSAPPTESLYSNNFVSGSVGEVDSLKRSILNGTNDTQGSLSDSVFSPRQESIPQSPAQIDPFYSQGDAIASNDVLDDTAVTVFGFPPAASSFILQQFAQYGTIEKHEIHNAGNWLHLKYQTKIQAKKALSKNGKIFARSIMIGVCPCIKKEISIMEAELNSSSSALPGTPIMDIKRPCAMRPLTSSGPLLRNVSASESLTNEKRTPQKNDSVVGKALDYVFGW